MQCAEALSQIFQGVPDRADPLLFQGFNGAVQFDFKGQEPARYCQFREGAIDVRLGQHDAPAATLSVSATDFVELCEGRQSQFLLISSGRATFKGDPRILAKMRWVLFPMKEEVVSLLRDVEALSRRAPVKEVPTVGEFSLEHLKKFGEAYQPFVVRGWLARSPATRWTLASVDRDFGEHSFVTELSGPGLLKDFIALMRKGGKPINSNATRLPPPMEQAIGEVPGLPEALVKRPLEIFFTSTGASSSLHRDMLSGVLTCLLGPREVRLYGPEQKEEVYCYRNAAHGYQACHVDTLKPDLEKFPKFQNAKEIRVTIHPGDICYLPAGWFHQVVTLEDSIAVKFNLAHDWPKRLTALCA